MKACLLDTVPEHAIKNTLISYNAFKKCSQKTRERSIVEDFMSQRAVKRVRSDVDSREFVLLLTRMNLTILCPCPFLGAVRCVGLKMEVFESFVFFRLTS